MRLVVLSTSKLCGCDHASHGCLYGCRAQLNRVVRFGDEHLAHYREHGRVVVTREDKEMLLQVSVDQVAAAQQPSPSVWSSVNCTDQHAPPRRFRNIVGDIHGNARCMENPTKRSKPQRVYVAMTTIARKLNEIQRTLTSLAAQTRRPDGVLVTVPERSYRYQPHAMAATSV